MNHQRTDNMNTTDPKANIHPRVIAALPLMLGGCFAPRPVNDPYDLAGPRYRQQRQAVLSALLGRKAKAAESGVNAIRDAFAALLGVGPYEVTQALENIRQQLTTP